MTDTLVDVVVALPLYGRFTYRVPPRWANRAVPGARVLVPFAGRARVAGVIAGSPAAPPEGVVRELSEVLDEERPALPDELLSLLLKMADYYLAPPGEVVRLALPAGAGTRARPAFQLTPAGEAALRARLLPADEVKVLETGTSSGRVKGPRAQLERLVRAGLLERVESAPAARAAPVESVLVALGEGPAAGTSGRAASTGRRREVWQRIRDAGDEGLLPSAPEARDRPHVTALCKAGQCERRTRERRFHAAGPAAPSTVELTAEQTAAAAAITGAIGSGAYRGFLLFGVTGSGKTEVYLHAIAAALGKDLGAIVLVPEIALTPQLGARFRARFGDEVAILHSGLGDAERLREWHRLRTGAARVALGARSALFAPVARLGIVVVDEEHDGSFKQEDGVRYHARDVAQLRAFRAGATCVLGSATPSLETWQGAGGGRLQRLDLTERPTGRPLPEVRLVDLREYRGDEEALLSGPLADALSEALLSGEQAMLLLNRRGFSTFVLCRDCGHPFRCPSCAVSLTWHKGESRLRCHYCGHGEPDPRVCPACKSERLARMGRGTERVEDALRVRFPSARIARLDRDTATFRTLSRTLEAFRRREIDLLVGTQMIAKGHDFPGVTLVGVINADAGLHFPDFRATERTFQLLAQVAGRAGRGGRAGRVIVQTRDPRHPAIQAASRHDYAGFATQELEARAELSYPPYAHLVCVRADGPDPAALEEVLGRAAREVAAVPDVGVLGPAEAPLSRLKGRHRWQMLLRATDRGPLRRAATRVLAVQTPREVRLTVDVDPVGLL